MSENFDDAAVVEDDGCEAYDDEGDDRTSSRGSRVLVLLVEGSQFTGLLLLLLLLLAGV